jgi:hypothetical protein
MTAIDDSNPRLCCGVLEFGVCHGSDSASSRADRFACGYFRAAQAYMLISMPTGTSTILGVFQVIAFSRSVRR